VTNLAREYGDGLYMLAVEEKQEEAWLDELKVLKQCFKQEPDFVRLLGNLSLSKEERLGILDNAFRGHVQPYVLNFLKILCERGALNDFGGCVNRFQELFDHDHNVIQAVVTTGSPMTEDQRKRMLAKLTGMTAKRVTMVEHVDPALLGGVVLEMDGKRYDNSVAHRLETMRRAISGRN